MTTQTEWEGAVAGKAVLITGASRGIGEAAARLFADKGAKLGLAGRPSAELKAVAKATGAELLECDVADAAQVEQAIAAADTQGLNIVGLSPQDLYGDEWIAAAVVCPYSTTQGIAANFEADAADLDLDAAGVEASTGSACASGVNRASHVLLAQGVSERDTRGAVRFTLGRTTTEADVDKVLAVIGDVVTRARTAGMAG